MVIVQTPPNLQAIVVGETPYRIALLFDQIDVNLQVKYNYLSPSVYFEKCRGCEYLLHSLCIGGEQRIVEGKCRESLSQERRTKYVRKTIPPHVVFINTYFEYDYFIVESTPDSGDLHLVPLLLGNMTGDGTLCDGRMRGVDRWNFCQYYPAVWQLCWTGDYNYTYSSIDELIENWSVAWQEENHRDGKNYYDRLKKKLFNLLDVNSLDECTVYPPGNYELFRDEDRYEDAPVLDGFVSVLRDRLFFKYLGA